MPSAPRRFAYTVFALCLTAVAASAQTAGAGSGVSGPADPQVLRTLANTLRMEGIPTAGVENLTSAEAHQMLNTLHGGDDLVRLPIVGPIKLLLSEAAKR